MNRIVRKSLAAFVAGASLTHAGAVVSLVPDNPGPHFGGETLDVGVWLSQDPGGSDIYLRGIRFDFNASDPAIGLKSFSWDFSGQYICGLAPEYCGSGYEQFPGLEDGDGATVNNIFSSGTENLWSQIMLPSTGTVAIGHITVNLPSAPGAYLLDAMNPAGSETNPHGQGAEVYFGFADQRVFWRPVGHTLTGGQLLFAVVPEPTMLMLLGLGGVAAGLRRRMTKVME